MVGSWGEGLPSWGGWAQKAFGVQGRSAVAQAGVDSCTPAGSGQKARPSPTILKADLLCGRSTWPALRLPWAPLQAWDLSLVPPRSPLEPRCSRDRPDPSAPVVLFHGATQLCWACAARKPSPSAPLPTHLAWVGLLGPVLGSLLKAFLLRLCAPGPQRVCRYCPNRGMEEITRRPRTAESRKACWAGSAAL